MRIAQDRFASIVRAEAEKIISSLPAELRRHAEKVPVLTADVPTKEQADDVGDDDLLGIFEGRSLRERHVEDMMDLPARIILFRVPLMTSCSSMRELREEVRITILHELGHYLGFDEGGLIEQGLE